MSHNYEILLWGVFLFWFVPSLLGMLGNYFLPEKERGEYLPALLPIFSILLLFEIGGVHIELLQERKRLQKHEINRAFERIK